MPLLPRLCFQINIEDLEEVPGVNGDRTDCLLIDAAASGNKRRAQRGHSESKKDGDVTDAAVPPEQVQLPLHTPLAFSEGHFVNCPAAPRLPWEPLSDWLGVLKTGGGWRGATVRVP